MEPSLETVRSMNKEHWGGFFLVSSEDDCGSTGSDHSSQSHITWTSATTRTGSDSHDLTDSEQKKAKDSSEAGTDRKSSGCTRSFSFRWYLIGFVSAVVVCTAIYVAIIFVGSRFEQKAMSKVNYPDLYKTTEVCAVLDKSDQSPSTFSSIYDAHYLGYQIVHCGACGKCSNPNDLFLMSFPTNALEVVISSCMWKIGKRAADRCLREKVPFTPLCRDCWLHYTQCAARHCKFTCLKTQFTRDHNACVACKETICAPGLLSASGVNRNRLGFFYSFQGTGDSGICSVVDLLYQ
mmetsp:Transcript_15610/g.35788  ORF Transcript_15610/g.35788 Transcript_15610/m.35788 type:complete len:293 (-) Transcript_15610:811-1689(-)